MSHSGVVGNANDRLMDQLGSLLSSGLPLSKGLTAIASEIPDSPTRKAFIRLAGQLEAGVPLNDALSDGVVNIPPHLRALITAGVRSGRLPEILSQIAGEAGIGRQIRRKFWISLLYPALLLGFTGLVFGILSAFPTVGIGEVIKDFGLQVPTITQVILNISDGLHKLGPWIVLGPALITGLGYLLMRVLFSAAERSAYLMKIPLIGPLYRATALTDFFRILSWLLDAQVPLPEAIPMAGAGTGDAALHAACVQAATHVTQGKSLAASLSGVPPFPDGLDRFLNWAEQTDSPGESLRLAASMFEVRARSQGRFSSILLSSLILVLLGTWVFINVIGLVVPMLSLLRGFMF